MGNLQVGGEIPEVKVTPDKYLTARYAGASGDFNPIHVDHEFARTTPFQQPIAHGLLVFSIASGLGLYNPAMRTLACGSESSWPSLTTSMRGRRPSSRAKVSISRWMRWKLSSSRYWPP